MKTRSRSVMPRLASAAMTSGCVAQQLVALDELVDGEVGLHAGNVFERLDPVVGQRHHALVGGVGRALAGTSPSARRAGASPPSSNAASSALPGSIISMEANRQPSPTPCSRSQDRATAVNSSADERIQWVHHDDHAITSTPAARDPAHDGFRRRSRDSVGGQREALPRLSTVGVGVVFDPRATVEHHHRPLGAGVRAASRRRARRCG